MKGNFSTLKISNLNIPKFCLIQRKKCKAINNFLYRIKKKNNNLIYNINNSGDKLKHNFLSINAFRLEKQNFQKTLPNSFRYTIRNSHLNPSIFTYTNGQFNKIIKSNKYKILPNKRDNKANLDYSFKRKKNIRKVKNQGMETSDSFYKRNKSKIYYRNLSLGKDENNIDNLTSFNNERMKELFFNLSEKSFKNFPLTKGISQKILKDKYAYIYMSDKSELIKHWRRANYNPLNV